MIDQWNPSSWIMPLALKWHIASTDDKLAGKVKFAWQGEDFPKAVDSYLGEKWTEFTKSLEPMLTVGEMAEPIELTSAPVEVISSIIWMRKNIMCFGMYVPGLQGWYFDIKEGPDKKRAWVGPPQNQVEIEGVAAAKVSVTVDALDWPITWKGQCIRVTEMTESGNPLQPNYLRAKVANALTRLMLTNYGRQLVAVAAGLRVEIVPNEILGKSSKKGGQVAFQDFRGYDAARNWVGFWILRSDMSYWALRGSLDQQPDKEFKRISDFSKLFGLKVFASKDADGSIDVPFPPAVLQVALLYAAGTGGSPNQLKTGKQKKKLGSGGSQGMSAALFGVPTRAQDRSLRDGLAAWGMTPLPVAAGLGHELMHACVAQVPSLKQHVDTLLKTTGADAKVQECVETYFHGTDYKLRDQLEEAAIIQGTLPAVKVKFPGAENAVDFWPSEPLLYASLGLVGRSSHHAIEVGRGLPKDVKSAIGATPMVLGGNPAGPPFGGGFEFGVATTSVASLATWTGEYKPAKPVPVADPAKAAFPCSKGK